MDFSAFNPNSTNALNMAARSNDTKNLKILLRKQNPNCVDNRGWTCLHEAASNNHYDSLKIILKHPDCRPLVETFEGHTALYLSIRNKCSIRCIKLLLNKVPNIAQYASNEMVSPLHLACLSENLEVAEILLQYNSIIDLQDFDGDTALHEAVGMDNDEVIALLLHAGADPEKRNHMGLTPFHLACAQGYLRNVRTLFPFIVDIDDNDNNREDSPLMIACRLGHTDIVQYLLSKRANPNLRDIEGHTPLISSVIYGHSDLFKILLRVTSREEIAPDIFLKSCMPLYFDINVLTILLESDLDDKFFNQCDIFNNFERRVGPVYRWASPLHSFLRVANYIYKRFPDMFHKLLYLVLMRGVSVNALVEDECPPLVYFHYCNYSACFDEVVKILVVHGCNIDYKSLPLCESELPDIIQMSLASECETIMTLLEYSILTEPEGLIEYAIKSSENVIFPYLKEKFTQLAEKRQCLEHLKKLLALSDSICTLQHICRRKIREAMRKSGLKTTSHYLLALNQLPIPETITSFLRYKI